MMIKSLLLPILSASLLAAAQASNALTPPTALPLPIKKLLDKKYKGWQLAPVAPAGGCTSRMGDSPAFVTADFNSDGFTDWGLEIKTATGVKLIAVMAWQEDYRIFELDASPDAAAARFLGVGHRGTKFMNPQTTLEDYFTNDTLLTLSCGRDQVAYLWVGFNFVKAVLPG
jgi:hypothetical protein